MQESQTTISPGKRSSRHLVAAGSKGESAEGGTSSAAQPESGAGVKRKESAGRKRHVFSLPFLGIEKAGAAGAAPLRRKG